MITRTFSQSVSQSVSLLPFFLSVAPSPSKPAKVGGGNSNSLGAKEVRGEGEEDVEGEEGEEGFGDLNKPILFTLRPRKKLYSFLACSSSKYVCLVLLLPPSLSM